MEEELEIFNKYFKKYSVIKLIDEKMKHSCRVKNYAYKIAKSLNITKSDINLVKKAALLHDIGRVPQFYFHRTFNDEKSVDHGNEGYNLLKDEKYENQIVLNAVKYHNKYKIDDDLSSKEKLVCDIVRDADKLDIMYNQGLILRDESLFIPDDAYYAFKSYQMISNSLEYSDTLTILRLLAFIFDMNFYKGLEIINNDDLVSKKINIIYDKFNDIRLKDIENILKDYINEQLKNKEGKSYGRIRKKY